VRRRYTVEDANRTLPYVRSIVREVRERFLAIQERGRRHKLPAVDSVERDRLKNEIRDDARRIHDCMCELEEIGLDLRDYESGRVDFPTELHGEPILLSWQYDEPAVRHWHAPDADDADRHPIPAGAPQWPLSAAPAGRG
jgi:hypothetical protein